MAIEITVPRLGWSMEEGTFVEWLKVEGEPVQSGDMLYVLEGEKVSTEIESFDNGSLRILPNAPAAGDTVAVGQLLGYLVANGETAPFEREGWTDPQPHQNTAPESAAQPKPITASQPTGDTSTISPRARRVAEELGIEWQSLTGTGSTGRIREADVRAVAGGSVANPRKVIAQRMSESSRQTVPVTITTRADATELIALRKSFADNAPSYNALFIKLAADALAAFPALHSQWRPKGLYVPPIAHIALAMDTQLGLLAPVIRDPAAKSPAAITREITDLASHSCAGKLQPTELTDATFTITNLGAFGIDAFTPVINLPQCAILGLGRIAKVPAVVGDAVVPRKQITLSLTFDHRIVDGVPAARFLARIRDGVESPPKFLRTT